MQMPLFDYQKLVFEVLHQNSKHLWIKKATGLGITELLLRYMTWLCLKDSSLKDSQMCIVTGPRIDLAVTLIDRIKRLFPTMTFHTKETMVKLNDVTIEAFPSHHLDAMRGLPNVSFILLDEADFFPAGQQQDARDVSERYIAKSNPYIVMVSTPNAPGGLFEQMEHEPEESCLYRRLSLDYRYGLNKIYSAEEIQRAQASPSFDREYDLKYLGLIGNVFSPLEIDECIRLGKQYVLDLINPMNPKALGIDPAFGSSNFAFCLTQLSLHDTVEVLIAEEYERPNFNEMIKRTLNLIYNCGVSKVYVDGANPVFISALKLELGERTDYLEELSDLRRQHLDPEIWTENNKVVPVNFSTEHKELLGHAKHFIESGQVAIHPQHDKLITSLRTAVANEFTLYKEATAFNDLFDAFRLSLRYYDFE
jgi:hypothetical protein